MASGIYNRPVCPGCGKKTLTPGGSTLVSDAIYIPSSTCRSCGCAFSGGLLVRGPNRALTDEMRKNRAAACLKQAEQLDRRVLQLTEEAKECRATADALIR